MSGHRRRGVHRVPVRGNLDTTMDTLWPGLTEYAREVGPRALVGVREGLVEVLVSGGKPEPQPGPPPLPPWYRWNRPIGLDVPSGAIPLYAKQPYFRDRALTEREAAALTGTAVYWSHEQGAWVRPGPEELSEEEAREVEAYLAARWFKRGFDPTGQTDPWRDSVTYHALNGPVEGREARWFSTGTETWDMRWAIGPDWTVATRLQALVKSTLHEQGYLAAAWDWTQYQVTELGTLLPPPRDYEVAGNLWWPTWADEVTARRRLLQHAADLLFEANPEWRDEPDKKPVAYPSLPDTDEWTVVARLLDRMIVAGGASSLGFTQEGSLERGRGLVASLDTLPAVHLWLVIRGLAHLRRCQECNAWVLTTGRRPRTLCSARCKQKRYREKPRRRHRRSVT